ncbi:FRG domain-containing protein [Sphingomonas sp. Leaf62]|uniref:FRG domain-containing protein n=1 Tax=Sphingomonas sp. Leaf62 TaxID=1736228 RepID=UPI0009EB3CD1|nr:FRG domain-containing protein [Sphingomonas sp. Leaf62]
MIEREIESIGSFLAARIEDRARFNGATWYRGHSDASWKLQPSYIRKERPLSETSLISRFRQSAAMLTERMPKDEFDWLFLMQHYGVPTRLLDWSESPLVGLYFALENHSVSPDTDAALWCLSPTILNKNANIVSADEPNYIPSFEDIELQGYIPSSVRQKHRLELYPVATIATRNNARIQAQLGTFTIHHANPVAIEAVGDKSHIIKYVIPAKHKETIANEVAELGIDRFSLFPELSSVGLILSGLIG